MLKRFCDCCVLQETTKGTIANIFMCTFLLSLHSPSDSGLIIREENPGTTKIQKEQFLRIVYCPKQCSKTLNNTFQSFISCLNMYIHFDTPLTLQTQFDVNSNHAHFLLRV